MIRHDMMLIAKTTHNFIQIQCLDHKSRRRSFCDGNLTAIDRTTCNLFALLQQKSVGTQALKRARSDEIILFNNSLFGAEFLYTPKTKVLYSQ